MTFLQMPRQGRPVAPSEHGVYMDGPGGICRKVTVRPALEIIIAESTGASAAR